MDGVTFGNKHSERDFKVYLKEHPIISTPVPRTVKQDVPGMDGVLDLTEAFGPVTYENRTITLEFLTVEKRNKWLQIHSEMMNAVMGEVMQIRFDDDPDFYYSGRVKVGPLETEKAWAFFTVECDVFPYKFKNNKTVVKVDVKGQKTAVCNNLKRPVVPMIQSTSDFTLVYEGTSTSIHAGESIVPTLLLRPGQNRIECTGSGTITFTYQEGGF